MIATPVPEEILSQVEAVYSDGGVKGANPSHRGGTWAFVYVAQNVVIHSDSGIVKPYDIGLPTVSNNVTELLALLLALEQLPDDWSGQAFTDSLITLRRFESIGAKMNGVPDFLAERVREQVRRHDYTLTLLAGHPSKADLLRGHKLEASGEPGYPVSKFNAMCDDLCNRQKDNWNP